MGLGVSVQSGPQGDITKRKITSSLKDVSAHFVDQDTFGPWQVQILAHELERNPHVKCVSLFCIGNAGEALGSFLSKNTSLTALDVWQAFYVSPLDDDGVAMIAKGMMANTSLTSLQLSFTGMTIASGSVLAEMIRANKTLQSLKLDHNENLVDGAAEVANAVVEAGRISHLSLSWCNMSTCVDTICASLKRNTCLRVLNLFGNLLNAEGARMLAKLLCKDCVLEDLNLSVLGQEGVDVIADALIVNTTLRSLQIGGNELKSGKRLGNMLLENKTLTFLDLAQSRRLEDDGIGHIAKAMKRNSYIKVLRLPGCGFGEEGALCLADMLRCNSSLLSLDVMENYFGAKGARAFEEALVGHRSLASLFVNAALSCSVVMEENGSLVDCKMSWLDVCARNRAMHNKAREAVQALRVLRWRQGEQSMLHMMAKEVVKIIGVALWNTRTEIAVWKETRNRKLGLSKL